MSTSASLMKRAHCRRDGADKAVVRIPAFLAGATPGAGHVPAQPTMLAAVAPVAMVARLLSITTVSSIPSSSAQPKMAFVSSVSMYSRIAAILPSLSLSTMPYRLL